MGEGYNPTTGQAWGCTPPVGWVPYPPIIPRRHPLLDAVGRIDDPCARPAHDPPDYGPTPKGRRPREGYPNAMCDRDAELAKIQGGGGGGDNYGGGGEPCARINIAQNTPMGISLRLQPVLNTATVMANPPTIEDCCEDARGLDTLKQEVDKVLGPHETLEAGLKNWSKCMSPCGPLLPAYPCRGVIKPPRPEWLRVNNVFGDDKCNPTDVSRTNEQNQNCGGEDDNPITGREFVEGKRTCDLYPIHAKLPPRFNNSEWFKGYGCEKPGHPFYITTGMDYGRFPPTAHTMTLSFYPKDNKFTNNLACGGMPRNRSLNLASTKYC